MLKHQSLDTTKKVFKIKETFSSFKTDKIDNIQRIIKGNNKPKLRINMTTKSFSKKQVIVLINNDNKKKFMKDSSNHITNLNKVMKNIKSDTMVDFVRLEISSITIVTNKVISALELQTIENYIKNINYIKAEGVEALLLPQSKSYIKIIGISYLKEDTYTFIML